MEKLITEIRTEADKLLERHETKHQFHREAIHDIDGHEVNISQDKDVTSREGVTLRKVGAKAFATAEWFSKVAFLNPNKEPRMGNDRRFVNTAAAYPPEFFGLKKIIETYEGGFELWPRERSEALFFDTYYGDPRLPKQRYADIVTQRNEDAKTHIAFLNTNPVALSQESILYTEELGRTATFWADSGNEFATLRSVGTPDLKLSRFVLQYVNRNTVLQQSEPPIADIGTGSLENTLDLNFYINDIRAANAWHDEEYPSFGYASTTIQDDTEPLVHLQLAENDMNDITIPAEEDWLTMNLDVLRLMNKRHKRPKDA